MGKRILCCNDSQSGGFYSQSKPALVFAFEDLFEELSGCFAQKRTWERARVLASGLLCSEPPHTITSWLIAMGLQDVDWTGSYDFFSHCSWEPDDIFDVILGQTSKHFLMCKAFFAAIDEVHLKKSGRKIPGVSTLRDPLGLCWTKPLHRAQRWLNVSALVPTSGSVVGPARGVPVDFRHAPVAKKPPKNASKELKEFYRVELKEKSISAEGLRAIVKLRWKLDRNPDMRDMLIVMSVDGSFTNGAVFGDVPERTVLVGRTAKNIALFSVPPQYSGKGRRRKYGDPCPTPEQLRQDDSVPWQKANVWACGKMHELQYKTIGPVLWKGATKDKPLRLIVIRPLSYRPRKGAKLLYREPAYLLVSDPDYPVELALQCYCHRWEIEVNHRDMKSTIGVGDAQVRHKDSAFRAPKFATAVYSLALLASLDAYGSSKDDHYGPVAKWRNDCRPRPSTKDILTQYKRELQQAGIKSFVPLASNSLLVQTAQNSVSPQAIWCGNGDNG